MSRHNSRTVWSTRRLECLEERQLMAVDLFISPNLDNSKTSAEIAPPADTTGVVGDRATEALPPTADERMGLPMLDSLPGAPRTLFLDFTGNIESDWWQTYEGKIKHYSPLSTPAYDTNGNPALFSTDEQQEIRNIWAAVAEDFAPFNINVTTHFSGALENGKALKVAIGGNDDWLDRPEGKNPTGTSEIRSFLDDAPNTVFVFSENFGNTYLDKLQIATTASHEAGHAFGLLHRSVWKGSTRVNQYDPGTNEWTPIMGQNNSADRTTWGRGKTEDGPNTFQDEFAMLGGVLGFRPDESGTKSLTSNSTTAINATLNGGGLINHTTDVDAFQFTTGGGQVKIVVSAIQLGSNLIPRAELWSASSLIKAGTFNGATASLSAPKLSVIDVTLPAGTYFIRVAGGGDYGDVGQYTVKVTTTFTKSTGTVSTKNPVVVGPTTNVVTTKLVQQTSTSTGKTATSASSDGAPLAMNNTSVSLPVTRSADKRQTRPSFKSLRNDDFLKAVDAVFCDRSFN